MRQESNRFARVALFGSAALLAVPAVGQDATVAPPPLTTPEAQPSTEATRTAKTAETGTGGSSLPWILLGPVVLAGIVGALLRRRRRTEPMVSDGPVAEPAYAKPVPAAPAAADRPWLELALRPVRAGATADEARVEIELTVGNAGTVVAEDVRISTFMLPAGADGEMDRLLGQSRVDAAVSPLTIEPGEGTRIDATLALALSDPMADDVTTFQPVVVADARYSLPDGSEGRTSASFLVGGIGADGAFEALALDRLLLRDDVAAKPYRHPARV